MPVGYLREEGGQAMGEKAETLPRAGVSHCGEFWGVGGVGDSWEEYASVRLTLLGTIVPLGSLTTKTWLLTGSLTIHFTCRPSGL